MAKIQKTADELKSIILDRIGIKTTVCADKKRGWTATAYALRQYTLTDLNNLDRLLIELRSKYDLSTS